MTVYRWECGMRAISPYLHLALESLENLLRKEGNYGPINGVPGGQEAEYGQEVKTCKCGFALAGEWKTGMNIHLYIHQGKKGVNQ